MHIGNFVKMPLSVYQAQNFECCNGYVEKTQIFLYLYFTSDYDPKPTKSSRCIGKFTSAVPSTLKWPRLCHSNRNNRSLPKTNVAYKQERTIHRSSYQHRQKLNSSWMKHQTKRRCPGSWKWNLNWPRCTQMLASKTKTSVILLLQGSKRIFITRYATRTNVESTQVGLFYVCMLRSYATKLVLIYRTMLKYC